MRCGKRAARVADFRPSICRRGAKRRGTSLRFGTKDRGGLLFFPNFRWGGAMMEYMGVHDETGGGVARVE